MTSVEQLLDEHGFELLRTKKHHVYGHEDGRRFVRPSTPSDSQHGEKNSLSDLCRLLGIKKSSLRERPEPRRPVSTAAVDTPVLIQDLPIQPSAIELPAELVATLPELTSKEQKMLRRWERQHKQKTAKRGKIIERLQWAVIRTHEAIFEDEYGLPLQAAGEWLIENLRKHEGFTNAELVTAVLHVVGFSQDEWVEMQMVSAFGFVLDPISAKVRTERQWQGELAGERFEIAILEKHGNQNR